LRSDIHFPFRGAWQPQAIEVAQDGSRCLRQRRRTERLRKFTLRKDRIKVGHRTVDLENVVEQGRKFEFGPFDLRLADIADDRLVGDRVLSLQVRVVINEGSRVEAEAVVEKPGLNAAFIGPDFLRLIGGPDIVAAALEPALGTGIEKQVVCGRPFQSDLWRRSVKSGWTFNRGDHESERVWLNAIAAIADGIREEQDFRRKAHQRATRDSREEGKIEVLKPVALFLGIAYSGLQG